MTRVLLLLLLLLVTVVVCVEGYKLQANYTGSTFFDNFYFFTDNDPTHGYVNFVSEADAWSKGLIYAQGQQIIIGCDVTNVASGRGRDAIRLTSKQTWNSGLFILDTKNMPTGCGTWPAWWLVGPNWPNGGEIDIIEGVNDSQNDQTTLHTNQNCAMDNSNSNFTGKWATGSNGKPATNCDVNAPDQSTNQGCGIVGANGYYGTGWNNNLQGGVYALEWTSSFIRAFVWQRGSIPHDVTQGNPNTDNWGKPYAYFSLGNNCNPNHFQNLNMVFDLTFCGDWAGSNFNSMCPNLGDCQTYVKNNPSAFKNAYWWVQYVEVYQ